MNNTIKFKSYYNNDNVSYDELPQFILDKEEQKYHKTSYTAKRLFFYIYNKDIRNANKKSEYSNTVYFCLTNAEIMSYLDVSENTAKKYKRELVDAGLILEKASKGKNANRYAINRDLDLKKASSTYIDKAGNQRFTFYKVPSFLQHAYFKNNKQCDDFIYSIIRHRINLSISSAEQGKRDFVDNGGKVFCRFTINELLEKLNLRDKNVIKDARNRLIATGLLKESTTYNNNKGTSNIKFYVYEPIALPVETKKANTQKQYVLIYRGASAAKKVLSTQKRISEEKGLGINKNEATPQKNEANLSKNINFTHQKTTTRELELRELFFRELLIKHLKHMNKTTSVSNVQHSENVINFTSEHKRTKNYPKALAVHINKYSDEYIHSFCDVINKGKANMNKSLNTNYTIEDVERALITAVNNTGKLVKANIKTQSEIEAYLMGSVKKIFQQLHDSLNSITNNQMNSKRYRSKEMTPKWLLEKENSESQNYHSKEMTPKWLLERDNETPQKESQEDTFDPEHEKERIAFLQHLKERWGDDEEKLG